ncbi:MAG: ABC transporter ATP-binding protein, partial [Bdellovibrionota bacterium]
NFLLRIYQMVDREIEEGKRKLDSYKDHYLGFLKVNAAKNVIPSALGIVVISIVTFFSVRYFGTDKTKLLAFYYIFIRAAQGASDANNFMGYFKLNLPALQELMAWTTIKKTSVVIPVMTDGARPTGGLEISANQVGFSYESNHPVISDMNLKASKGDFVVIRGKSGTGKSTLLSLLLGLLKPNAGTVLYNGEEVSTVAQNWFKALAYVGPEPFLVRGSVKQNLLYGHYAPGSVSDREIWETLEKLELKDVIETLPGRLEFLLNEKAQLSTGQKQRISIARALLRKPSLLIMDEATSNLDNQTEGKIVELLNVLKANLLIIAVTHKTSFDSLSTKMIVLEGSHA